MLVFVLQIHSIRCGRAWLDSIATTLSLSTTRPGVKMQPSLSLLGALTLVLILLYITYQKYFSPLHRIPGPWWAPITNLFLVLQSRRRDSHLDFIRLHGEFGNTIRIGPNTMCGRELVHDDSVLTRLFSSTVEPHACSLIYGTWKQSSTVSQTLTCMQALVLRRSPPSMAF